MYESTWDNEEDSRPMGAKEFLFLAKRAHGMMDSRFSFICFKGEEPVGYSITIPDYNQIFRRMKGSLWPFGWWHMLIGRSRIDRARGMMLGVDKNYAHLPIGAMLYNATWKAVAEAGMSGVEIAPVSHDNSSTISVLDKLGAEKLRTWTVFERLL